MNVSIVYACPKILEYFEYLKGLLMDNLLIFQIGRSEIFGELGRVFVILDVEHGVSLAKDFIDDQPVEKLFLFGPPDFVQKAKISFSNIADEIYIRPP